MRKICRIKNHWLIKKHIKCFYYHNCQSKYPSTCGCYGKLVQKGKF